ncbi:unnamed protein product [Ixodes persulcatus]
MQLPSPLCCLNLFCECIDVVGSLLLLSGDVEVNPGPGPGPDTDAATTRSKQSKQMALTSTQSQASPDVIALLTKLSEGQDSLLREMQAIKKKVSSTEQTLSNLSERISGLEKECSSFSSISTEVQTIQSNMFSMTNTIACLEARIDDAENRSRRNNLIFYGLRDVAGESWHDSEKLIIDTCSTHLAINLEPLSIERAHRIGRFSPEKKQTGNYEVCVK